MHIQTAPGYKQSTRSADSAPGMPEILTQMQAHIDLRAVSTPKEILHRLEDEIALNRDSGVMRDAALFYLHNRKVFEDILGKFAAHSGLRTKYSINGEFMKAIRREMKSIPASERSTTCLLPALTVLQQNELVATLAGVEDTSSIVTPEKAEAIARYKLFDLVVPSDFRVDHTGIFDHEDKSVCKTPIFILGTSTDTATGHYFCKLIWFDNPRNKWIQRSFPNSEIADSHKICAALAKFGIPVTSNNATCLIKFFDDWKSVNAAAMVTETRVSSLGWYYPDVHGQPTGFIYPNVAYGDASEMVLSPAPEMNNLLRSLSTAGSEAAWLKLIEDIAEYTVPFQAIYTVCASIFLAPVFPSAEPFIVDLAYASGSGKTTALKLAASVFGKPEPGTGLINSWNDTMVAMAKKMDFLKHLPMILDESQTTTENRGKIKMFACNFYG